MARLQGPETVSVLFCTVLTRVGPGVDLGLWAVSPQVTVMIPAVGCHYLPPGLQSPSQPESITAPWPVPNYRPTAWWQRHMWHMCVCVWTTCPELLPGSGAAGNWTRDLSITSPSPTTTLASNRTGVPPRVEISTKVTSLSSLAGTTALYGTADRCNWSHVLKCQHLIELLCQSLEHVVDVVEDVVHAHARCRRRDSVIHSTTTAIIHHNPLCTLHWPSVNHVQWWGTQLIFFS